MGSPEIIVGYVNAPGAIYWNDGTGREFYRTSFGDNEESHAHGLAAGDLDGDGYPDIVAARSGAPEYGFPQSTHPIAVFKLRSMICWRRVASGVCSLRGWR